MDAAPPPKAEQRERESFYFQTKTLYWEQQYAIAWNTLTYDLVSEIVSEHEQLPEGCNM